jgi:hypothetical protein
MSDVPANNPINTTDLDTEYPVPGQDNDSQGFRDNFTVINANAVAAKARLEDIEENIVRKDEDTTFVQSSTETITITNANLKTPTFVKNSIGQQSGPGINIDFSLGDYQTITLVGNTTLNISNPPYAGVYQKVVLEVTSNGTSNLEWDDDLTIKFDTASSAFWDEAGAGIAQIGDGETHIIELWTHSGTTTFFAKYIGQFN